jgi:hypothetical protein
MNAQIAIDCVAPDVFVRGCAMKTAGEFFRMPTVSYKPLVMAVDAAVTWSFIPRGGPFDSAQGRLRSPYTRSDVEKE